MGRVNKIRAVPFARVRAAKMLEGKEALLL